MANFNKLKWGDLEIILIHNFEISSPIGTISNGQREKDHLKVQALCPRHNYDLS